MPMGRIQQRHACCDENLIDSHQANAGTHDKASKPPVVDGKKKKEKIGAKSE